MLTRNLTPQQKQTLFAGMKRNKPELVELIKSDDIQELLKDPDLDACLYFDNEELAEILR